MYARRVSTHRRSNTVTLLIITLGPAVALAADQERPANRLFRPAGATAPFPGATTIEIDDAAFQHLHQAHQAGVMVSLNEFPLSTRQNVDLFLRPISVLEPGASARIVTDSGIRRYVPQVATFSVHARGGEGSFGFLGITPRQVNAYFTINGEAHVLTSGSQATQNQALLVRADAAGFQEAHLPCGCGDAQFDTPDAKRVTTDHPLRHAAADEQELVVYQTKIFVEGDPFYRERFDTAEDAADYAVILFTAVSSIYRRDLGAELIIPDGYVRIWETEPPWGVNVRVREFYTWWRSDDNPLRDLERDLVHLLQTGGVSEARVDALCPSSLGYGVSIVGGWFPLPLQHVHSSNWDPYVVAHELGHNFGSLHTWDYDPPIEEDDGSGPDGGTIMSYRSLLDLGLRFHARVQEDIRQDLATSCTETVGFEPGDYDHNGVLDELDVAAAEMCVNLEFEASGCLETFDLYPVDGHLNRCDYVYMVRHCGREILAPIEEPPEDYPFYCQNCPCEWLRHELPGMDCNRNGRNDCDEIVEGESLDCNFNGVPDDCDLASGTSSDCNSNAIPDECETDCNVNGQPDDCDIAEGSSADCNTNEVPDECDIEGGSSSDCNDNTIPDECDLAGGTSEDCNSNSVPDECEDDCNENGEPDECDIMGGISQDDDGNTIPDECQQIRVVPSDEYPTIQAAIDAANPGDTVSVTPAIYTGEGNHDLRMWGRILRLNCDGPPGACIIDCENQGRGLTLNQGEGQHSVIDGFTIVNGFHGAGGGILCDDSSPTIVRCSLLNNLAQSFGGGGIYVIGGAPTIRSCLFVGNVSNGMSAGGGGVRVTASSEGATIENCTMTANRSTRGGGLMSKDSIVRVRNCLLWDNVATAQGPELLVQGTDAVAEVLYSDLKGGADAVVLSEGGELVWGEGNLDADPLFVDPDAQDYHIPVHSPCVNAGDLDHTTLLQEMDIDGDPRVGRGRVDIGADEHFTCRGDVNGDALADMLDIMLIITSFGDCPGCQADLNGDGVVDVGDIVLVLRDWGECL